MKWLTYLVMVVVVLLAGVSFWYYATPEDREEEVCIQVLTDARNIETGEIQTFSTPCAVPEGWIKLESSTEEFSRNGETWKRYNNDSLGLQFEYRIEPNGYILIDKDIEEIPQEDVIKHLILFNRNDYEELLASTVPRDGPPGVSILIFNNPNNLSPRLWVEEESMISGINIALSDISNTEISGMEAIRYQSDGLYTNEKIVISNNGRIYLISGDSPIKEDFLEILEHISLY